MACRTNSMCYSKLASGDDTGMSSDWLLVLQS
jgi:hypothetical protein